VGPAKKPRPFLGMASFLVSDFRQHLVDSRDKCELNKAQTNKNAESNTDNHFWRLRTSWKAG
jgi:hypothetical protein